VAIAHCAFPWRSSIRAPAKSTSSWRLEIAGNKTPLRVTQWFGTKDGPARPCGVCAAWPLEDADGALRVGSHTANYVIDGAMWRLLPRVGVEEAMEAAGATLRFPPAYSADLNPIEQVFSNSKRLCAKVRPAPLRGS
jgi:hypothetical protein